METPSGRRPESSSPATSDGRRWRAPRSCPRRPCRARQRAVSDPKCAASPWGGGRQQAPAIRPSGIETRKGCPASSACWCSAASLKVANFSVPAALTTMAEGSSNPSGSRTSICLISILAPYARQYNLRIGIGLLLENVGFDQAGIFRVDADHPERIDWYRTAVSPSPRRRWTVRPTRCSRCCATISPRSICSVPFFEPTTMGFLELQDARNTAKPRGTAGRQQGRAACGASFSISRFSRAEYRESLGEGGVCYSQIL